MKNETIHKELEKLIFDLEENKAKCLKGILKIDAAQQYFEELNKQLETILDHETDAYKIFDRMRQERTLSWQHKTGSEYVQNKNCEHFDYYLEILNKIVIEYEPEFIQSKIREKSEYYFSGGQKYEATKVLFKIMQRAVSRLSIVDTYLDNEIFDYIDSLDSTIRVKMLTSKRKPIFKKLYNALKSKNQNIEAKECNKCHDRFLIIDDNEIWHSGTSFNAIGKDATVIKRIEDKEEKKRFLVDFQNWWKQGNDI